MKLRVVVVGGLVSAAREGDTKGVVEPGRADGNRNEGNPEHKYVSTCNKR